MKSVSHSVMSNFSGTLWTAAHRAPLSMELSRQEYWSGLPFPSPGDLPDPGIDPGSPALQADSSPSEPPGKPLSHLVCGILLQQLELRPLHVPTIVQLLSHVRLLATLWTVARQASLSSTISWSLPKLICRVDGEPWRHQGRTWLGGDFRKVALVRG